MPDAIDPRHLAYVTVSGTAINCNRENKTFEINAAQYVSILKPKRQNEVKGDPKKQAPPSVGSFPIKCDFADSPRFKAKPPTPKDGAYVTLEGFLTSFVLTPGETFPHHFTVRVESITFLGRTTVTPPSNNSDLKGKCSVNSLFLP